MNQRRPGDRVVVTGAAGNLGSGVVERLVRDGRDVVALVQDASQLDPGDPARPPARAADLTSFEATRAAIDGAAAVVHLAAMPSPAAGPAEVVFANNCLATFNVLHAARTLGVRRVVLASSVSAYGMSFASRPWSPMFAPITEGHELRPSDPYGLSKQVNEATAVAFARAWPELTVTALRFHWIATQQQQLLRIERDREDPSVSTRELWGYVDRDDAIEVVVRSLSLTAPGFDALNVCAPDTLSVLPTEDLMRDFHPGTPLRAPLPGRSSPWSSARCRDTLGYAPTTSWRRTEG